MKKIIVALIFICISSFIFASSTNARIIPISDSFYDDIDTLYSLSSLARPTTTRPWSVGEATDIFNRINPQLLGESGKSLYDKVKESLNEVLRFSFNDGFSFDVNATISLEAYAHTNSDFNSNSVWVHNYYNSRKPLAEANVEFQAKENFYTMANLAYGYGPVSTMDDFELINSKYSYVGVYPTDTDTHIPTTSDRFFAPLFTNVCLVTKNFNFEWPSRADFSLSGNNWNFLFARDRLEIGNSKFGNMLVDDHITYHDFMKFDFHTDYFKYQMVNIFLNTLTSRSEDATDSSLIYMIHTLEFRAKQKLSFMISENVMYRSQIGAELKFMNPSFIYHNLNNRDMFNAIAYAEVNYVPIKGLEFYGQFALDQATAPNEDNSQDPAYGFMIGTSYSFEVPKAIVSSIFEFSYTSPLLYRRDIVDFIEVQRYFHHDRNINGYTFSSYSLLFNYIGFPFGGDSIMLNWNTSINSPGYGKAFLKLSFLEKGSFNIFESHNTTSHINTDKPKSDRGKTPTYNKYNEFMCVVLLSTGFDADMSSFFNYPDMTISLYADYITTWNRHMSGIKNNLKSDLQVTLSTSFKF